MLYRYGSSEFWNHAIVLLHEKLRSDAMLRPYFERRGPNEVQMINFAILKAGLGYAEDNYEEVIRYAHQDRGITQDQMTRFVTYLRQTLDEIGIEPEDIDIIVGRISGYTPYIIDEKED
ncbi:unnamed protein product [Blepharisma stoltei]|uniref:Uncharacterized protein n=1 Tax=Blepharisma stoltei TaxID=1481888 RepID=A0AAU9J022_9CILI|nr:unnamed protein product [Blepharisma stoltei]